MKTLIDDFGFFTICGFVLIIFVLILNSTNGHSKKETTTIINKIYNEEYTETYLQTTMMGESVITIPTPIFHEAEYFFIVNISKEQVKVKVTNKEYNSYKINDKINIKYDRTHITNKLRVSLYKE